MPNHVTTKLTIIGDQSEIDKCLNAIHGGKTDEGKEINIDFNKIIPQPDGLDIECHEGIKNAVKNALQLPFHKVELIAMLEKQNRAKQESPLTFTDQEWDQFIQVLQNVRKHQQLSWYEWNCANWGTKWNAYGHSKDGNTIQFDTAWAHPEPVMKKLSSMYPSLKFQVIYADEDSGSNTGRVVYENGNAEGKYPESQSQEGYKIYFEINPGSEENYELVGGKYQYKDED